MYLPPLGCHGIGHDIQIESQVFTQVNKFKYLGSTVANHNKLDAELDTQPLKVSKAFGRLRKRVWLNEYLTLKQNVKCNVA